MKTRFIALCLMIASTLHASGVFISWKDKNRIEAFTEIPDPIQPNCFIKTTVIKQIFGECVYIIDNNIVGSNKPGEYFYYAKTYTREGIFINNIEPDHQTIKQLKQHINIYQRQHVRSDDCIIL